jgi:hypothetical protein
MFYRERLWPTAWVWIVVIGLCASLGIAYGAAYSLAIGLAVFLPFAAIAFILLVIASPVITISSTTLQAGRAAIPLDVLTRSATLDATSMSRALRLGEPTLFLMVRPWSVNTGVIIEVADPDDPHTSWVLSSRKPQALSLALAQAGVGRHEARPDGD